MVKHNNYKHLYQNIIQYIINYKHKRKNKQVKQNYNNIVKGNKKITLDNYCEKSDLIRIFNEI